MYWYLRQWPLSYTCMRIENSIRYSLIGLYIELLISNKS